MSFIINGIKMSGNCDNCKLRWSSFVKGTYCSVTNEEVKHQKYSKERHEHCPLSEIPTPHGDLIDRDAYIAILDNMIRDPESSEIIRCVAETVRETLLEMAVVVPAED